MTENIIKSIPFADGCSVVGWHPCGLLAINKRSGRMSHPNQNDALKGRSPMIRANYNFSDEYYSWNLSDNMEENSGNSDLEIAEKVIDSRKSDSPKNHVRLYLINRLDSPTSGIVLASTDREVADIAKEAFKNRKVEKVYYAVCLGRPFQRTGTISDRIMKKEAGRFVRSVADSRGVSAITEYCVEQNDANGAGLSLVRLSPHTGLTHQLRVQCAQRKFPILGDATYGDFRANRMFKRWTHIDRLFLHCFSTKLSFEYKGEKIVFSADVPLPESFNAVIGYNFAIAKNFKL